MTPHDAIQAQREFLDGDRGPSRGHHLRALRRRLEWLSAQCKEPNKPGAWSFIVAERHAIAYAIELIEAQRAADPRMHRTASGNLGPSATP